MSGEKGTILLCAGGTGGHLFPAESLAHELKERGWSVHLATDTRTKTYTASFPADGIHTIDAATIGSKNPVAILRAFWKLWTGFRQASALMQRLKPKAVIGFGGYPTLPPVFAATRRDIPTIIHEQNAVMGRANRALAPRVSAIAGGFLAKSGAHAGKITVTGNPVRDAVLAAAGQPYPALAPDGPLRLLVFGGSQGARYFSDTVPEAVALLEPDLRKRLTIVQQARPEDEERVRARYRELGVEADVAAFFKDLPQRMAASHLVISRSGASSVLELATIGRPAILVPLPHALDDDQGHNAKVLTDAGAAVMHREPGFGAAEMAGEIVTLAGDAERLTAMAAAAQAVDIPDAVRLLADLAEAIAAGRAPGEPAKGHNA